MPNLEPLVSIVILNWNSLEDTRECLQSLRRIAYSNRRIVVVDNGSAAREAAALRDEFGDVSDVIENETNLGFAAGANLGIRHALKSVSLPVPIWAFGTHSTTERSTCSCLTMTLRSSRRS